MLNKDEKKLKEIFMQSRSYSGPSFQSVMKGVEWAYYPSLDALKPMGRRRVALITFTAATVFLVTGASIFLTRGLKGTNSAAADSQMAATTSSGNLPTSASEAFNSGDIGSSAPDDSGSEQTSTTLDSVMASNSETASASGSDSVEETNSSATALSPLDAIVPGTYLYDSANSTIFNSLNSVSAEAVLEEGNKTGLILKYGTYTWTVSFVYSGMKDFTYTEANWDASKAVFKGQASYNGTDYSLEVSFNTAKQMTFIFNDGNSSSKVIFIL